METAIRALAEPHRRQILRLVRDDELTVGEIAGHFPISRPAVSQHLRTLEEADLVTVRPAGNRRYYRARPAGLVELREWLDDFWRDRLVDLKQAAEEHHRASTRTVSTRTVSKGDQP
ncbi:MAG: metalloregulator ArsR/SmtB family transcription factor [Acidimicrobiia bacterium]|nr:metalloregulator ArsR/SmtB family transcription factor [Acidimicrobiia bacterium]